MLPMVILGASILIGIGSMVCWILTLVKIFGDVELGGAGKGIFGIICGLYAFIWGWQNHERHNHKNVMLIWTVFFVIGIASNVMSRVMLAQM